MILTIDVDKESPERLRRIARLLEEFAEGRSSDLPVSSTVPDVEPETFSMFDEPKKRLDDDETANVVSSLLNQDDVDDEDKGPARVTPY